MPKADQSTTETLFHHWRRGDAGAGRAMAQRFTDWYYAIALTRLGEHAGNAPFRAACQRFSQGVPQITDPRRLLTWAHGIASEELHAGSGHRVDGDLPNAFTQQRSPRELLLRARGALPDEMRLLEKAYSGAMPNDPYEVLKARYAIKIWLRDHEDVPFKVTPQRPDPDRVPLPFYESGHLEQESEELHFELWMLNDLEACQDIAEFAHYAIALRGGLPEVYLEAHEDTVHTITTVDAPAPGPVPVGASNHGSADAVAAPATRTQGSVVVLLSLALALAVGALLWVIFRGDGF